MTDNKFKFSFVVVDIGTTELSIVRMRLLRLGR